jgi:hypothetical protein
MDGNSTHVCDTDQMLDDVRAFPRVFLAQYQIRDPVGDLEQVVRYQNFPGLRANNEPCCSFE